jgi:hypothetical protein
VTYLTIDTIKKRCAFVIRIDFPLATSKAILTFLVDRMIEVESLQWQAIGGGEAICLVHFRIERDRLKLVQHKLAAIGGVLALEVLESRGGNIG